MNTRRSFGGNVITAKQAVSFLLGSLPERARQKVKTVALEDEWAELMGEFVAKRTVKIRIQNSTLFLGFDSPAMKESMFYRKTEILEKVQAIEKGIKRIFWC